MQIYQRDYQVKNKEDKSLVTEADLASEEIILKELKKYNYGIISEEEKNHLFKEKTWVVDPLDGTKDFLYKTGEFSLMVGLLYKGKPILGVVYLPDQDKAYFAQKGKGAYLKKGDQPAEKLKVSNISNFKDSRLVVSRFHLDEATKNFASQNNITQMKPMGSIGVKLGLIAEGRAEAYLTFSNKTCQWDTCAPEIIF